MRIFREVAGYTFGRADLVRRAMSKKKADVLEAERESFIEGAAERGIPKNKAEKLFDALGLNMTTAVNIFLRQAIRENGIPFEVKLNMPNETTASAIREGRSIAYDKTATGYSNMADLRAALEV